MIHRPSARQIRQILTSLDKPAYASLVQAVMRIRTQEKLDEPLSTLAQLKMYLYEWLTHLNLLSDSQIRLLIAWTSSTLEGYARYIDKEPIESVVYYTLSIVDGHYAVWSDSGRWLDLISEIEVDELPRKVTFITCNLYDLFLEKQEWLTRLQGGKDGQHQHHAAGVPDHGGAQRQSGPAGDSDPPK